MSNLDLEGLYKQYGKLMIQKEIIDNRILETKSLIAKEMGKSNKKYESGNESEKEKEKEKEKDEKLT